MPFSRSLHFVRFRFAGKSELLLSTHVSHTLRRWWSNGIEFNNQNLASFPFPSWHELWLLMYMMTMMGWMLSSLGRRIHRSESCCVCSRNGNCPTTAHQRLFSDKYLCAVQLSCKRDETERNGNNMRMWLEIKRRLSPTFAALNRELFVKSRTFFA